MWPIAVKTLIADRGKLLTALVGVIFSVVLVNVQCGLFLGLIRKAALLIDYGQADIWVGHRKMHNVDFTRDIPRRWVHRIRPLPGVKQAQPYLLGFSAMTLPSGGYELVEVVGVDRASLLGNAWNLVRGSSQSILHTDGIIIDEEERSKLDNPALGDLREIGGRRVRVVGMSHGIMGFLVNPYVFTTYDRAAAYLNKSPEKCSYVLVKLEPGADPQAVCDSIRRRLPEVEVYTRDEYSRVSVNYWMTRTGLGISFGAATLLGLFVGLVMVAQTLYAMVLDRLPEFGTLKCIGANESQVYSLLLAQAVIMATTGSMIGLSLVLLIQRIFDSPKAPIVVPLWLSLLSFLLVLIICLISSLLPYLRIRKIDPVMTLS